MNHIARPTTLPGEESRVGKGLSLTSWDVISPSLVSGRDGLNSGRWRGISLAWDMYGCGFFRPNARVSSHQASSVGASAHRVTVFGIRF
ncbi:MAG: hypothetical protein D6723_18515 [Acidobacteria bacterium]|nr:MAG: hypothetical protein D6723_18515 [Acidobacteriota bacterium]